MRKRAKWKSVDLEYPIKGWEQYDCVRGGQGYAVRLTAYRAARP
jgi:hypothetical protein